MKILVDADACPVNRIIADCAATYKILAVFITDTAHQMSLEGDYIRCITVDKGRDSADFSLINRTDKDDLVITGDYGVASMALTKQAKVLNFSGKPYESDKMDFLLMNRHISKEIRKAGGKTPAMKKRKKEQDHTFRKALVTLLDKHM